MGGDRRQPGVGRAEGGGGSSERGEYCWVPRRLDVSGWHQESDGTHLYVRKYIHNEAMLLRSRVYRT